MTNSMPGWARQEEPVSGLTQSCILTSYERLKKILYVLVNSKTPAYRRKHSISMSSGYKDLLSGTKENSDKLGPIKIKNFVLSY